MISATFFQALFYLLEISVEMSHSAVVALFPGNVAEITAHDTFSVYHTAYTENEQLPVAVSLTNVNKVL